MSKYRINGYKIIQTLTTEEGKVFIKDRKSVV